MVVSLYVCVLGSERGKCKGAHLVLGVIGNGYVSVYEALMHNEAKCCGTVDAPVQSHQMEGAKLACVRRKCLGHCAPKAATNVAPSATPMSLLRSAPKALHCGVAVHSPYGTPNATA